MRARSLASRTVPAIVVAVTCAVPAWGQQKWHPRRTPDGQPDLQGVWLSNAATPLERPQAMEGKALLTDDEVKELRARADRIFNDGKADAAPGDNFFLATLANPAVYKNPNATGGAEDLVYREFENRTSLIVDPPDGKIPWTPEGLLPRIEREDAPRRAIHTRRPRHDQVRSHRQRSDHVDETVERRDSTEADAGTALRSRVPRRKLRHHHRHPLGRANKQKVAQPFKAATVARLKPVLIAHPSTSS